MARIVLAMSGGVDSSVAAHLLCQAGHEVIGLFMRHGEPAPASCAASPAEASSDSSAPSQLPAASPLPIVDPALSHKQGCARTPNPCVMCNNWIKFGRLWEYAEGIGAEYIATGHYARLIPAEDGSPALCRGLDGGKDQSYVLFGIDRDLLPRLQFPVGGHSKTEIRALAAEVGLRVADKKDSQEICFVAGGDYADFVRRRRGEVDTSGEIVTTDGQVVARHDGIEQFTIGQRKGLGIAFGEPRYVVRIDADSRQVVIGRREELACTQLTAGNTNWLIDPPATPLECEVKIRYLSQPVAATVTVLPDNRLAATLVEPKHGVAPGQAVVCYHGDRVLGGGWIE